jgi:hypothetical protein
VAVTAPPLANVTAICTSDGSRLERIHDGLCARYDVVVRPAVGWIVVIEPLPGSRPVPDSVREGGIVFMEGADLIGADASIAAVSDVRRKLRSPGMAIAPLDFDVGAILFGPHEARIVRSVSGRVPVYVGRPDAETVVISTLLSRQAEVAGLTEADPLSLAIAASSGPVFPDGRTPIAGVRCVPPGHAARVTVRRTDETPYWDIPAPATKPGEEQVLDRQHRFRTSLLTILERELSADSPTALALSGGVDSSCLGVLASKLSRPLVSYTYDTEGDTPEGRHNRRYLAAALAEAGIECHVLERFEEHAALEWISGAPRSALPTIEPVLMRLGRIPRPFGSLMGGWWADETTGSWLGYRAWLRARRWGDFVKPAEPILVGRAHSLRRKAQDQLQRNGRVNLRMVRPAWLRPDLLAEFDAWHERSSLTHWAPHPREELLVAHLVHGTPSQWEVLTPLGIRPVLPFAQKAILDVSYECHPDELLFGETKSLLRGALARDVSHLLLGRKDKGRFQATPPFFVPLPSTLPTEVLDLMNPALEPLDDFPLDVAEHLVAAAKSRRDVVDWAKSASVDGSGG